MNARLAIHCLDERYKSLVSLLLVCTFYISGCMSLPPPIESVAFKANYGTSSDEVFSCAKIVINQLKEDNYWWDDSIKISDASDGFFETEKFTSLNAPGISTQIEYNSISAVGVIKIKAVGIYFVSLGAKKSASALKKGIVRCIAESSLDK